MLFILKTYQVWDVSQLPMARGLRSYAFSEHTFVNHADISFESGCAHEPSPAGTWLDILAGQVALMRESFVHLFDLTDYGRRVCNTKQRLRTIAKNRTQRPQIFSGFACSFHSETASDGFQISRLPACINPTFSKSGINYVSN